MITKNFIEESRTFLSKRRGQAVSHEEARESIRNVVGFFELLAKWRRKAEINPLKADEVYVQFTDMVSDGALSCEVVCDSSYWNRLFSCFFQKYFKNGIRFL